MQRRDFLKGASAIVGACLIPRALYAEDAKNQKLKSVKDVDVTSVEEGNLSVLYGFAQHQAFNQSYEIISVSEMGIFNSPPKLYYTKRYVVFSDTPIKVGDNISFSYILETAITDENVSSYLKGMPSVLESINLRGLEGVIKSYEIKPY